MLQNNNVTDLQVLVDMAKKDSAGDMRFALFWNIYLADNPLSNAANAQTAELRKLGGRIHDK